MSRQFHTMSFLFSLLMLACPMWGFSQEPFGNPTQFLIVPPANFHSLASRSKTDWDLMTTITFGAAFSPMHGWANRLTEEERWDVLRYIRLLAPFNPMARYQPASNG